MAHEVKWTRRASRDLIGIATYIAEQRSDAAQREGGDILRKVELLENFPEMGRVYRRTPDGDYRSVLSGKYRIVYSIRPDAPIVDIVTVRHGAQGEPDFL